MGIRVTKAKIDPDIVLLHLAGHLTLGLDTEKIEWQLRRLLYRGERKVIFDLAGVGRIDSDAALLFVRCFIAARESGAELRFAAARPSVFRRFHSTTLDTLLPFDTAVDTACEYFRGCLTMLA